MHCTLLYKHNCTCHYIDLQINIIAKLVILKILCRKKLFLKVFSPYPKQAKQLLMAAECSTTGENCVMGV